ncbi:hypothetical protein LTR56_019585 [Elasticomyces elasticus]|nr:hypothetical protein LTR56_019585 [Elasticomyces elasticus]
MFIAGKSLAIESISIKISIESGVESETMRIYGPGEFTSLRQIYRLLNADDVVKVEFSCTLIHDTKPQYENDEPYSRTKSEYGFYDAELTPGYVEGWVPDKADDETKEKIRRWAILEADSRAIHEESRYDEADEYGDSLGDDYGCY